MSARLRTVVVAWGGSERLGAALDAIEVAGRLLDGEIVVVGRVESAAVAAAAARATVRAPDPAQPSTPGAHRNQGAQGATTPWILFADDDVIVEPEFVARALALLEQDASVVGVGGRIHERQWRRGKFVREIPDLHKSGAGGDVEMLAAAWIARRPAFEAVGGFDPRLPAEEDMELCLRLVQAGGRVVALDLRAAYHDCMPRPSLAEIRRRFTSGLYAGQGLLLRHSWGTPLFLRHLRRQGLYLATFAYTLLGLGFAAFALVGTLQGRPSPGVPLALWATGPALAWAIMSHRKHSPVLGALSMLAWLALGIGIVRAWAMGDARTAR